MICHLCQYEQSNCYGYFADYLKSRNIQEIDICDYHLKEIQIEKEYHERNEPNGD